MFLEHTAIMIKIYTCCHYYDWTVTPTGSHLHFRVARWVRCEYIDHSITFA